MVSHHYQDVGQHFVADFILFYFFGTTRLRDPLFDVSFNRFIGKKEFPFRSTLVLDVAYPTCMTSHRQQLRHADLTVLCLWVRQSVGPWVCGSVGPPPLPFRLNICQPVAAALVALWKRDANRWDNPVS